MYTRFSAYQLEVIDKVATGLHICILRQTHAKYIRHKNQAPCHSAEHNGLSAAQSIETLPVVMPADPNDD